jgi:hypothetical protein
MKSLLFSYLQKYFGVNQMEKRIVAKFGSEKM